MQVDDLGSNAGAEPLDPGASGRRLVEIRCGFAEMASREAEAAEARVAEARWQFDAQLAQLTAAQTTLDPGAIRTAKDEAHRNFRKSIGEARSREQVELAAVSWLAEINRVNGATRGAQLRIQRDREATDALAAELDRLTAMAETSRAMAESAVEACRAAQEALTAPPGEEGAGMAGEPSRGPAQEPMPAPAAAVAASAEAPPAAPAKARPASTASPSTNRHAAPGVTGRKGDTAAAGPPSASAGAPTVAGVPASAEAPSEESEAPVDLGGSRPPALVRLLQRDRATLLRLVDWLSGPNTEQRRRWQLCLSNFVDAVVATAIDDGCFVFAAGNPFWDQLTPDEARETARGLAALGFRYDGMGEFADGRVPSQRDLSMALGQAGLLTVRVRHWPRPEETAALYRYVQVDPIALLAEKAPSLTMGELVLMLGRRAELAADLWNDWSRARPLLLLRSRE